MIGIWRVHFRPGMKVLLLMQFFLSFRAAEEQAEVSRPIDE